MSKTIRGLTVEISADASKFNKQMSAVRKDAKTSQTELNALQKSLQLEFDDKKFAQAQQKAQAAIDATAEKAQILRDRLQFLENNGSADTSHYRQIQSELAQCELEGQQLHKQLEKINQIKFDNLTSNIKKVSDGFTNAGKTTAGLSIAAAGTITGLAALGKNAISTADEIETLATKYDMSATALQKFNYIALQSDVDAKNLYKAFVKVRSGLTDIATGATSTAGEALRLLNIDLNSLGDSEAQFYGIVNALADMEDKTQMVAIANDIFGDKLANELLPLIYSGRDAIAEYADEFDSLGALTDDQVSALSQFDNVLNKIKTQFANVAAQIGASLLPIMQRIASIVSDVFVPKLQQLADWFNSLTLSQQEMIAKALLLVAALSPVLLLIGKLTSGVGNLISMLPQLSTALSSLAANPIMLTIAAVAAVLMLLYTKCEEFRESINNLVSTIMGALQPILQIVMELLSTIANLLTPIINTLGGMLAVLVDIVVNALSPFFKMLSLIFGLIQPLLQIALIPLQLALQALAVPLQVIGQLLGWLSPIFTAFANVVQSVFAVVIKTVNFVLGVVEDAVNFCISIINKLIDGVNSALGWLGVHINRIGEIKLRVDAGEISNIDDLTLDTTPPDQTYDKVDTGNTTGDIYNNDYSTNTKTQNVTVVIQNYADDVDVDDLVRQINIKLAEAL